MTDLDQRARDAGAGLRAWDPGTPIPTAGAVATRAVRRTRRRRAAAGTVLLGAVAGIGLMWGGLRHDGDRVRTGSVTTATSDTLPSPTTSVVPGTTTPSTTEGPGEPSPATSECSGAVGGVAYEVNLPEGWHVNEAQDGVPACWLFGPQPVEASLAPAEADTPTIHSNAVVWFGQPYPADVVPPGSFDERMTASANALGVVDSQRTTIDGRPAARVESVAMGDGVPPGERYVMWHIDLGRVELTATMMTQAVTYEEAVAALDAIVQSLRFTG